MSRVLVIGCGGVANVAIRKCCQADDVFTELCIASRTKSKCDALAEALKGKTKTVVTTAQVDADKVDELVDLINSYKPDFLYTNKSTLLKLALYVKNNNVELHKPKHFCPTGEKLDENSKKLLREVFGDNLIDSYGTTETGAVLTRFSDNEPYITNTDSFVVNIYDDDGNLADEGRIVITPLYCTDLPIINYVIGDRVKSEIFDGVQRITEIEGRMNDYFKHSDGSVTTYFEMNKFLGEFDELVQLRFIQKSYDRVIVQCVKNIDKDTPKEEVERILDTELNSRFKEKKTIEFEWMESIPPDVNGKLRVIVCEV